MGDTGMASIALVLPTSRRSQHFWEDDDINRTKIQMINKSCQTFDKQRSTETSRVKNTDLFKSMSIKEDVGTDDSFINSESTPCQNR